MRKSIKTLTTKSKFLKMAALPCLVLTFLFTSCSKDHNDAPENGNSTYPKEVNIEYRVSAVSGVTTGRVLYVNSTGGNTTIDQVSLPYSVKLKRTVNQLDDLGLSFSAVASGEAKSEILVDNQVVASKTFSGTSYLSDTVVYLFN